MRRILYFLILLSCLSGFIFSCSKENYCASDVVAYLKLGFYTWSEGRHEAFTVSKLSVRGISSDNLIYNNVSNKKTIELPLSNLSDTSRFVFTYMFDYILIDTTWIISDSLPRADTLPPADTLYVTDTIPPQPVVNIDTITKYLVDTLDIIYSRQMHLISPLCGFGYDYEIIKAFSTHHYIDSIRLVNPSVTIIDKENEDNIEILY